LYNGIVVGDVKADTGGGYNLTARHMAPPGDDSQPLPGDYVATIPTTGEGNQLAIAYLDPVNQSSVGAGGKRIYARDPATGATVCQVWLRNNGDIIIATAAGSFTMGASGDVTINGVTIDTSGNITTTGAISAPSVIAATKELAGHTHSVTTAPGTTGPNL